MNKKRIIRVGSGFALVAVLALGILGSYKISAAKPGSTVEAPKFVVDPTWPHVPNGWTLGQVSSAAADPDGNIWLFQRPGSVHPGKLKAPPVMEFNQAGEYVQGWGGPEAAKGQAYTWPSTEHGITVDYKGNVWVSGNGNDDQVLKFTKDGKFLMQIGKANPTKTNADTTQLWKPADVFVYPKTNEIFVADGYGNRRVIVFDAETGAFKRMWGAFGNVPMDPAPASKDKLTPAQMREEEEKRTLATEFDPKDPGPSQFQPPVHGVKVSNDGIVYVADRGGKRVQTFTTDGKFITQVWIDRWCLVAGGGCNNGNTAASVAFSADPNQRFLYVASRSPARIWVFDRKTLQPLDSFGRPGIAPGEFDVLHHMTTDNKGNLYTSEVEDGRRIQKFAFKGMQHVQPPAPETRD